MSILPASRLTDGAAGTEAEPARWPAGALRPDAIDPRGTALRFVLSKSLEPGIFAFRVKTAAGASDPVLLNRPCISGHDPSVASLAAANSMPMNALDHWLWYNSSLNAWLPPCKIC